MKIRCYRKLGTQGRYACSLRAAKQAFRDLDILVCFGLTNVFEFDYNARNTPRIQGTVVASFSVNNRERTPKHEPMLLFYPLLGDRFSNFDLQKFEAECIPTLLAWHEKISKQSPQQYSGVLKIIIEYRSGGYIAHEFKYM